MAGGEEGAGGACGGAVRLGVQGFRGGRGSMILIVDK